MAASHSHAVPCTLCAYLSPSLVLHISHLRLVHASDRSFQLTCNINGCTEEFRSFSSYNSHVYRNHRIALGLEKIGEEVHTPCDQQQEVTIDDTSSGDNFILADTPDYELQELTKNSQEQDRQALQKENAAFLLRLSEEKRVSQVAIDDIVRTCRKICQQTATLVLRNVSDALQEEGIAASEQINVALISVPDPFEGIDSAYLLEKFCRDNFDYVVSVCNQCIIVAITHMHSDCVGH